MGKREPDVRSVAQVERRLGEMERAAPPVGAIEALRRSAAYAVIKSVSAEADGAAIGAKLVDMARDGDIEAIKVYSRMVGADAPARPSTVSATQVNFFGAAEAADLDEAMLCELRRQIVFILAERKGRGMTAPAIGRDLNLRPYVILLAVNHPWFRQEADGWHHTSAAEAEVLTPPA